MPVRSGDGAPPTAAPVRRAGLRLGAPWRPAACRSQTQGTPGSSEGGSSRRDGWAAARGGVEVLENAPLQEPAGGPSKTKLLSGGREVSDGVQSTNTPQIRGGPAGVSLVTVV